MRRVQSSSRRHSARPKQRSSNASSGVFTAAFEAARERAGSQVGELVQQVKTEGQEYLHERKNLLAEQLTNVSGAIRRAADKLQDSDSRLLARYVDRAADKVEDVGRYVEQRDLREVLDDAGDMARRQPTLFMSGMFLAGLAAARFLKAATVQPPRNGRSRRR